MGFPSPFHYPYITFFFFFFSPSSNYLNKLDAELRELDCFLGKTNGAKRTITQLFEGKFSGTVMCERCSSTSVSEQSFSFLTLNFSSPTHSSSSISLLGFIRSQPPPYPLKLTNEITCNFEGCLQTFSNPEELGENAYFCENCQDHQNASKFVSISELPEVLQLPLFFQMAFSIN